MDCNRRPASWIATALQKMAAYHDECSRWLGIVLLGSANRPIADDFETLGFHGLGLSTKRRSQCMPPSVARRGWLDECWAILTRDRFWPRGPLCAPSFANSFGKPRDDLRTLAKRAEQTCDLGGGDVVLRTADRRSPVSFLPPTSSRMTGYWYCTPACPA